MSLALTFLTDESVARAVTVALRERGVHGDLSDPGGAHSRGAVVLRSEAAAGARGRPR